MMTLSYAGVAVLVSLLLSVAILLLPDRDAEGRHLPSDVSGVLEMSHPGAAFHNAAADSSTAFREEEAGFSAYYRVPEPADADASAAPRLNIKTITNKLRDPPDASDTVRFRERPGEVVEQGVNFAIVRIDMNAALGQPDESREITLYYDDRGWIVAYLKANVPAAEPGGEPAPEPAAAIWRYQPLNAADGDTAKGPDELLADNLLILGINAVLKANNPAANAITHETVLGYHDWQCPQCDAFILFSNQTKLGKSAPVSIVIPPTITTIKASAAALIAHTPVQGESARASVLIDEEAVVTATVTAETPDYLKVSSFPLTPDPEHSSVYRMAVSGDDDKLSVGVVMLVYDKPDPS